jgi:predicted DNA-binding transcriptional regulator AlpA
MIYFHDVTNKRICRFECLPFEGRVMIELFTRAVIRPVKAGRESLEEALTNAVVLDDWVDILQTLDDYSKTMRKLHRLLIMHSTNHDVFGPSEKQRVCVEVTDKATRLGMLVVSDSMLRALAVPVGTTLCLNAQGHPVQGGSPILVTTLISDIDTWAKTLIRQLPSGTAIVTLAQWERGWNEQLDAIRQIVQVDADRLPDEIDWSSLLSAAEVLKVLGIASTTLSRYRDGRVPSHKPPFPKPITYKGRSPYWCKSQIRTWRDSTHL